MSEKKIEISLPEYRRYCDLTIGQLCYAKSIKYDVQKDEFEMDRPTLTSNGTEYKLEHFDPEKNMLFLRKDGELIEKPGSINDGAAIENFLKKTFEFIKGEAKA